MMNKIHPTGLAIGIPLEDAVIAVQVRLEKILIHTRITIRVVWGDRFQKNLIKMETLIRTINRCSEKENGKRLRLMKIFLDEVDNARGTLAGLAAMNGFSPNPCTKKENPNYDTIRKQCIEKGNNRISWFVVALEDIEVQMERWRNSTMKKEKENALLRGINDGDVGLQARGPEDKTSASGNVLSY